MRHLDYMLNPAYDIKHIEDIFDKPIYFVPILMQEKLGITVWVGWENQVSSFFQPIPHPFADIDEAPGISRSPF